LEDHAPAQSGFVGGNAEGGVVGIVGDDVDGGTEGSEGDDFGLDYVSFREYGLVETIVAGVFLGGVGVGIKFVVAAVTWGG